MSYLFDAAPFPPYQGKPLSGIGREGEPIRVLSFAGGGFETAMQLGVVHALLVARARAPDIVIGASAGAISAVALAEVFQAGGVDDPGPKVARFRELFEAYRRAPGEIVQSLGPDPAQVDTQRPLETLQLPVHHEQERAGRTSAVSARAGLINLYNTLLSIRISVGTIARGVRCWLGIRATGAIRGRWVRNAALVGECFRALVLLGANLHRAATLVPPIVRAILLLRPSSKGATAAELIFAASIWRTVWRRAWEAFWTLVLIVLWLVASGVVVALIMAIGVDLQLIFFDVTTQPLASVLGVAFVLGALILAGIYIALTRTTRWLSIVPIFAGFVSLVALMGIWTVVLATVLSIPYLIVTGTPPPPPPASYWFITVGTLFAVGAMTAGSAAILGRKLGQRVLSLYSLNRGLLESDTLREFLVRAFNKDLYNTDSSDHIVDRALQDDNTPHGGDLVAKQLADYAKPECQQPIHIAIAVVDVESGAITTMPPYSHVVGALMAATAKPPAFPAAPFFGRLLVDATTVTHEPTQALLQFLRTSNLVHQGASEVHLYSIAPVPFGRTELGRERGRDGRQRRYTRLLDVVRRVLQLRRFRDATLERRLVELHTQAMPREGTVFCRAGEHEFVRMWIYPIEPEEPIVVNYLALLSHTEERRRRTMAEAVADGCRATLQMIIQPAIDDVAKDETALGKVALCHNAVVRHLKDVQLKGRKLPGSAVSKDGKPVGPGVAEVCEHCVLYRRRAAAVPSTVNAPDPVRVSLIAHESRTPAPSWPAETAPDDRPERHGRPSRKAQAPPDPKELQRKWAAKWPAARGKKESLEDRRARSTISLLFSGGVFRGVFQVGVLNALSELSLYPDIVAGASVGSITAAMAARAFVTTNSGTGSLGERQRFVRRLAAAYLAIDRLILTDRFADFVRGITVRAAQARLSIRDADRVLRRFDDANPWTFSSEMRRVAAGFERLAYVSPFELRDIVEVLRRQRLETGLRLLERYFQELLDRAKVGQEVLGAEPLERLIHDYVLQDLAEPRMSPAQVTFDAFGERGTFFFATATNLSTGRLEALGDPLTLQAQSPNLAQALLASSAFPGVFRRRWSWEVHATTAYPEEYADGGVMDNLPLDAVARFLDSAATAGLVTPWPEVPHLIFAASLETESQPVHDRDVLDELSNNWLRMRERTAELAYNRKLELFARTQQNLQEIVAARPESERNGAWTPLKLEVVTVLPRWLCGTMAFHPMLGFRRQREARSIAHGCASTLLRFGKLRAQNGAAKVRAWGIPTDSLPTPEQSTALEPFKPLQEPKQAGHCWLRPDVVCPFSYEGQGQRKGRTAQELNEIYLLCKDPATHRTG